jgi:hypothetical protein
LAAGTLGLLKIADAFNVERFGDGLVEDFVGHVCILGLNFQFDSAKEIGDEPIHTDHVVIDEIGLNSGGLQTALRQQRLRKIAELAQRDGFVELENIFDARRSYL